MKLEIYGRGNMYMTIKDLRDKAKMSRKEFCEYLNISYRTVENWEKNPDQCKDYIIRALYYQLLYNGIISKDESEEK